VPREKIPKRMPMRIATLDSRPISPNRNRITVATKTR